MTIVLMSDRAAGVYGPGAAEVPLMLGRPQACPIPEVRTGVFVTRAVTP